MRTWKRAAAVAATVVFVSVAAAEWVVVEVPQLAHWVGDSEITSVNDVGEACGMGNYVINTSSTAFRFDGTTVTELPHLEPNDPITLVTDINDNGVVCGYSHATTGNSLAVYYVGTTMHVLPYPPDARANSDFRAYAINNDGVICGYYWNTANERTAFYYKDGVTYSLDAALRAAGLLGFQIANDVNDDGLICGEAKDPSGEYSGYTYDIDTGVVTVIGRWGLDSCSARAINASGQTVGRGKYYPWDPVLAALTYDGAWHQLDSNVTVTQWSEDINDGGRMIGMADTGVDRWIWYADGYGPGSIVEVLLPDWTECSLATINNDYWMVGFGKPATAGGDERGFIIKPPLGDADRDGFVQADDFQTLCGCLTGPDAGGASDDCLKTLDFDVADGDVDLADVCGFQLAFEGS